MGSKQAYLPISSQIRAAHSSRCYSTSRMTFRILTTPLRRAQPVESWTWWKSDGLEDGVRVGCGEMLPRKRAPASRVSVGAQSRTLTFTTTVLKCLGTGPLSSLDRPHCCPRRAMLRRTTTRKRKTRRLGDGFTMHLPLVSTHVVVDVTHDVGVLITGIIYCGV